MDYSIPRVFHFLPTNTQCLHIYGGVTLEETVTVSVFLLGFDVESSTHHIRLLDLLTSPVEEAGGQAKKAGEGAAAVAETEKI